MTMHATVMKVQEGSLLVYDVCKSQEVVVHTSNTSHFCVNDQVIIKFSGAMTMSIPPQISATYITKTQPCNHRNNCY